MFMFNDSEKEKTESTDYSPSKFISNPEFIFKDGAPSGWEVQETNFGLHITPHW